MKSSENTQVKTFLYWLLSFIYYFFDKLNKKMYQWKLFKTHKLTVPVISVGNLTLGGSGKTPFIIFLTKCLQEKKQRVAVVSRNYKAQCREIAKIDLSQKPAKYFGDEPSLIHFHTQAVGYVGPKKFKTAKELVRREKVDLILVDDGFQHHALFRDINILLLDVTQWQFPAQIFPSGYYRENFKEIARASFICWTRINLVSKVELQKMKEQVAMLGYTGPQFDFSYESKRFLDVSVNKIKPLSDLPKRVLLFCGLARPEILLQSLKIQFEKLDLKIEIDTFFLSDHQIYDENLLQKVINYQVTHKFFLTTEKDFIKFKEIWPSQKSLAVLLLEVELLQKEDEFYEAINHFLH